MTLLMKAVCFMIPIFMIVSGLRSLYKSLHTNHNESREYSRSYLGKAWTVLGIALILITIFLLPRLTVDNGSMLVIILSIDVLFMYLPYAWVFFIQKSKTK